MLRRDEALALFKSLLSNNKKLTAHSFFRRKKVLYKKGKKKKEENGVVGAVYRIFHFNSSANHKLKLIIVEENK